MEWIIVNYVRYLAKVDEQGSGYDIQTMASGDQTAAKRETRIA